MREVHGVETAVAGTIGLLGIAAVSAARATAEAVRESRDMNNLAGWVEYWQTRAMQAEQRLVAERGQAADGAALRRAQARVRDLEDQVELLTDENDALRDRFARIRPRAV